MITVIHTADWHIGQSLRGHGRLSEHEAVLAALVDLCGREQADALLVAGDVFDSQNPSSEAQALFFRVLARLRAACPALQIVLTAGNHDAAGRLEAPMPLLGTFGVRVVGSIRRQQGKIEGERHLIDLHGPDGRPAAQVLAVSYPTAACLPPMRAAGDQVAPAAPSDAVRALYADLCEAVQAQRDPDLPLIVMGHLHVAGGLESEGAERRILVGGEHAVAPSIFPAEAAYVALGHLHRAQTLTWDRARPTLGPVVRYSGSLLPLSASEIDYTHGVTRLRLATGVCEHAHLPLPRPAPFLRVPARGATTLAQLDAALRAALDGCADPLGQVTDPGHWRTGNWPRDRWPFVQVRLARDGLVPGFREQVDAIAEALPIRLVETRVDGARDPDHVTLEPDATLRLIEHDPGQIFSGAFERAHGTAPDPAHRQVFDSLREGL